MPPIRSYRSDVVPLTPALLVAAANAFVGVSEQGGDNRGQMVEHFLRSVHLGPGQPWCAAFVHYVGQSAHYDHLTRRSSWPLPATGSCEALARAARASGVLRDEPYVYKDTRDSKKVANILGHTDIRTTLNMYVHDDESVQDGVADRMEEMFDVVAS